MEQNSILRRDLIGELYEDAATAVIGAGFNAGGNQSHDLVVEWLPVTRLIFVPDHQVNRKSFQPPVPVRLHELLYKIEVRWVRDSK